MYQKTVFNNGLRLLTSPMPHTRSVCVAFFIGTGSRYETESEAGISHFTEHLSFKGTQRRPTSKEISEAIEGVGGILNGGTDKELTIFWSKVASQHFPLALDVLCDILRNSRFNLEDVERERQIIIEEINMTLDLPQYRVDMLIDQLLWPEQPLGKDVAGTKESVTLITRQQLLDYSACHYLPNNMVISVAGDINQEQVNDMFSQVFADWLTKELPVAPPASDHQQTHRCQIESRSTEQAHLCIGVHGLPWSHPDHFALELLNVILGEGMSSRLFVNIRERLGLAYDIHSYVNHFLDTGSVIVYAGVHPKRVEATVEAILEELAKLKNGVPEVELTKAKELIKGRMVLRMEDSRNVAGFLGAQEVLTGGIMTVDEILSAINAVSNDEIKQIARQLLITEKLNLAIVGPVAKEEPLLELLKL